MATHTDEARRQAAEEQAGLWLERMERTLKPDEVPALRAWLKHRLHRELIVDRCRLWHGPEALALLGQLVSVPPPASRERSVYGRMTLAIVLGMSALAISTALIAGSRLWANSDADQNPLRTEASYRTAVGEYRHVRLPDGSSMTLSTATHVLVSYGPHSRDITLLRGEASFDVIAEAARTLRIHTAVRQLEVGPVRSRLSVRKRANDQLDILVEEGQVTALDSRRAPLTPAQLRSRPSLGAYTFNRLEGGVLGPGWQVINQLSPSDIEKRLD
jgi:transmembrane sensor